MTLAIFLFTFLFVLAILTKEPGFIIIGCVVFVIIGFTHSYNKYLDKLHRQKAGEAFCVTNCNNQNQRIEKPNSI